MSSDWETERYIIVVMRGKKSFPATRIYKAIQGTRRGDMRVGEEITQPLGKSGESKENLAKRIGMVIIENSQHFIDGFKKWT